MASVAWAVGPGGIVVEFPGMTSQQLIAAGISGAGFTATGEYDPDPGFEYVGPGGSSSDANTQVQSSFIGEGYSSTAAPPVSGAAFAATGIGNTMATPLASLVTVLPGDELGQFVESLKSMARDVYGTDNLGVVRNSSPTLENERSAIRWGTMPRVVLPMRLQDEDGW